MRVLAVAALAVVLAMLAVLGGSALRYGTWPTGPDAIGFAASIALTGAALVAAVHWPVFARLRRWGVTLGPGRAALLGALGVNAPVYAVLAVIGRNRSLFAGGEAALLGLGFALIGLVFGAGYASIHRQSPTRR